MAIKKAVKAATTNNVKNTIPQTRPYSSPNAITTSSSRPYSTPNAVTRPANLPSSLPTRSAVSTVARNTTSTPTRTTSPTQTAQRAAQSVLNQTPTVSNYVAPTTNYVAPSTPSVSTPSVSTPSSNPASNLLNNTASVNQVSNPGVSILNDLATPSQRVTNPAFNNMTPSQNTDLMLSLLGSQTADTRLGNSNPTARNALNLIRQNQGNVSQTLSDAAYKTLVDSTENPNPNAPYSEVPNVGGYQAYDAILNPDAIVRNNTSNPNSLQTALENAAMSALTRDNNPLPATSALDSIVNPDRVPYGLEGGLGDISLNASAEGGDSTGGRDRYVSGEGSGVSRRGDGLGTGPVGNGYMDISALYDLLNQRLAEYDANYNSLLGNLNDTYANALNALGLNYADTEALLNGQLNASRDELEAQRRRQLQEAYISRMMNEKSLADMLDAYGLTGGASESVMADMRNNYANNRNAVEERVQNSLRDLLMNYLNNVTTARQRYNDSLYNVENSRTSALNDAANYRSQARAGAYEDLYNTLANLTMKGINYGS